MQRRALDCRHDRRHRHRNEATRRPLEQQQFHRQHDGGDRRAEHRGHAGGGARYQQRFALGVAHRQQLRDQRADCAAGHDDWPFRAERPAGADHHCRGERLQDCHPHIHSRPAEQDRLDRLGNAMAADFLTAVARHQPNHQRTGHRHQNRPQAERRGREGPIRQVELAEIRDVGGQPDQLEQRHAGRHSAGGHHDGDQRDQQHARAGREIRQLGAGFGVGFEGIGLRGLHRNDF